MRSLLFVPADSGPKLDKALASGADAVIVDLEDSIVLERKPAARAAALEFLKRASAARQRPRLLVRINGLDTGMTDADLDAIVAGKPDAVVFPKAEGGPSVVHLDAKLTAREALAGLPEGQIKIIAQAVESAGALEDWGRSLSEQEESAVRKAVFSIRASAKPKEPAKDKDLDELRGKLRKLEDRFEKLEAAHKSGHATHTGEKAPKAKRRNTRKTTRKKK